MEHIIALTIMAIAVELLFPTSVKLGKAISNLGTRVLVSSRKRAVPVVSCADPFAARDAGDLEYLGRGGSGFVYCNVDAAGRKVAMKFIKIENSSERDHLYMEYDAADLMAEGSANILGPECVHKGREELCIEMPFCTGDVAQYLSYRLGQLAKKKGRNVSGLREKEALQIFRQMVIAVARCHEMGFCHSDVKPENFLVAQLPRGNKDGSVGDLKDGAIKLTGFGLAIRPEEAREREYQPGTPKYMAPEVVCWNEEREGGRTLG